MVAYYRIEGQGDVVSVIIISLVDRIFIDDILVFVFAFEGVFLEILLSIILLGPLYALVESDVVLGLRVGDIAQVGIEQVVVVETYLEHLVHTAGIVSICSTRRPNASSNV